MERRPFPTQPPNYIACAFQRKRGFLLGNRALSPSPHPALRIISSSSCAAGRRSAQRPLAQQRLVLARKLFLKALKALKCKPETPHHMENQKLPSAKPSTLLIQLAQARTQGSKGKDGVEKWSEPHDLQAKAVASIP